MKKKKYVEKYPSGGYLSYQNGYKGFGIGPQYYQDNSYMRTIVPDDIENINERINRSSFMGDLSDGISVVNQSINDLMGMSNQFKNLFGKSHLGTPYIGDYTQQNPNNLTQDTKGIPSIMGGAEKLEGLGQGTGGNWDIKSMFGGVFPDGGEVPKMYNGTGRQSLSMFGNSFGQPRTFNSNSNRFGAGVYTNATANNWMNTKLSHDRQKLEDDKVDWGFFDFLREPAAFTLGLVANTAGSLVGLDDDFNNSYLGRTSGGKLGKGLGRTTIGAGKAVLGVSTVNPGLVVDGVGDVGQGTIGTLADFNAENDMMNYNKEGYISNKRLQKDMNYFNNITDQFGGMFGNINGIGGPFGEIFASGGIVNGNPIQAEKFQGQPEQIVTPDGRIQSTNAVTSHENMNDSQVTDVLPEGSHIQSSRNLLKLDELKELMFKLNPEKADIINLKLEQVYKDKYGNKKNKELSPSDITEYAKNKYQKKSTPNAFNSDVLKNDNKKDFTNLGIEINDLVKVGSEMQNMSQGGKVNKYPNGVTNLQNNRGPLELAQQAELLKQYEDIFMQNKFGLVENPIQHASNPAVNLYDLTPEEYQQRVSEYYRIIPHLATKYFPKNKDGSFKVLDKKTTGDFQKAYDQYVDKVSGVYKGKLNEKQINDLKALIKFRSDLDPNSLSSARLYDSKMGRFTSSRSGFKAPVLPKDRIDFLRSKGITHLSQAVNSGLLTPQELDIVQNEIKNYDDYYMDPLPDIKVDDLVNNIQLQNTLTNNPPKLQPNVNPDLINPNQARRDPRFFQGLMRRQLQTGLDANNFALNQMLSQSPIYYMETPDTYIKSRINELPIDNILYNIERTAKNTNQFLRDNTSDWSTLAGNTLNNAANMYNQIGDQLSTINEKNVNLYNTTQDKEQQLLENNMTVRNRNLGNMQELLNKQKEWIGQNAINNADKYNEYYNSINDARQKEDNQKLHMMYTMATSPDSFKGIEGQELANEILGRSGTYNNIFVDNPLLDILGGNSLSNLNNNFLNIFKKKK